MKSFTKTFLFALISCLFSATASAYDFEVNGIYYNILSEADKTVEVTYQGTSYSSAVYTGSITIPSNVVYNNTTFSVTSIGDWAFDGCTCLTSIEIPNSITSIGIWAFADCSSLTNITIPNSVTNIGKKAFDGCTKLPTENNVIYADKWAVGVSDKTSTSYTLRSNTVGIASNTFDWCTSMSSITIPNNVTSIGSSAFLGCSNLANIEIPYGITSIEDNAFSQCSNLTSIEIPITVTSIGNYAFQLCSSLANIIIPYNVKSIGDYTFTGCSSLASIFIPNSTTSIGDFAFNHCHSLNYVIISENVTNIGSGAFNGCAILKGNFFNSSNCSDPNYWGATIYSPEEDINGLIIQNNVLVLARGNITEVSIPEGITSIANYAFIGNINLIRVDIPNTVTKIGDNAFGYCSNLTSIVCRNPTPPTSTYLFVELPKTNCKLQVPDSSLELYKSTAPWSSFTNIEALPTPEITLTDGEAYNNSTEQEYDKITYTRTLPNLLWNCLYVPFEVPYDVLAEKYDVAYINGMHSYDTNEDGEIDKLTMEWIKIKNGTLKANYPYLIKAKNENAKNMTIVLENAILFPAESTTLNCYSIYTYFEITGTYQPISEENMDGSLAISLNGIWEPSTGLKANRFYLTITERGDAPMKISEEALSRISNIVIGDDSATGIEDAIQETSKQNGTTYDLSGRRVQNPTKGGVYIVNGKKVVF